MLFVFNLFFVEVFVDQVLPHRELNEVRGAVVHAAHDRLLDPRALRDEPGRHDAILFAEKHGDVNRLDEPTDVPTLVARRQAVQVPARLVEEVQVDVLGHGR